MANISDVIEQFILDIIGNEDTIKLSRNELANYFSCAPSQINYVLSTRFTLDKGFVIESRRGGGGFVTVLKLNEEKENIINNILKEIDSSPKLTFNKASDILERLLSNGLIEENEMELAKSMLSEKALTFPVAINFDVRKNIFKELLIYLLKK
ncbi:MAG: CtsR family transcriptional regulator [Clostridia bacterium]